MAINQDISLRIKAQEDELAALKANQIIAGSAVPIYTTTSQSFTGSVTFRGGAFIKTITFYSNKSGYQYMLFALKDFTQTSAVGMIGINHYCLFQLPQDGSSTIQMQFIAEASWKDGSSTTDTADFTFSITGFGEATGSFS